MATEFSAIGGARIGFVNATWPFAKITASARNLRIATVLGAYEFLPGEVVSIKRYRGFSLFSGGVQIFHSRPDYPPKIVFWCMSGPDAFVQKIRDAGFLPSAPESEQTRWHGIPLRWSAILFFLIGWNGLFYVADYAVRALKLRPEFGPLVPLLVTVLVCLGIKRSPDIQKLVLNNGHLVGEIKAYLSLLTTVAGMLLAIFTILAISGVSMPSPAS